MTPETASYQASLSFGQILRGYKNKKQKTKLVHNRTKEKEAVIPQETDPDLSIRVQESSVEVWVGGGLLQVWGH